MLFIISVDSYSRIAHCRQVGPWRVDNSEISLLICDLDLFHSQGLLSSRWWRLIYRLKISRTCIITFVSFPPLNSFFFQNCFKMQQLSLSNLVSYLYIFWTDRIPLLIFNFQLLQSNFNSIWEGFLSIYFFKASFYIPAESLPRPISSIFTRSSSQTFLQTSRLVELVTSIKMELVSLDIWKKNRKI